MYTGYRQTWKASSISKPSTNHVSDRVTHTPMDSSGDTVTATTLPHGASTPPTSPQPQPAVVLSPCAACKILRRRCVDRCVLAPYFPPTEPHKFATAHRVFGASNIIKLLQELPEEQRADAVSSMVYEASARIRDPVYGCAGAICHLQKQVNDLKAQLARAHAELAAARAQHAHLLALLCVEVAASSQLASPPYCAVDYSSQLAVAPTAHTAADALYAVDSGGLQLQTNPISWVVDEPLWT
ncbi:LOB domain-containing protein 1-like [Phragmites australis]|uniref:LOB domain-containing protein 1-like n=1 Tax=Phragmites australis TaxID=29695 RepID=UPI002D7946D2|nr:LOB domain-containing protein 1-like [Phragmites australis]